MILGLIAAFQVAAAPAATLAVRTAAGVVSVPIVETNAGAAVRADLVAAPLHGAVRALANGHFEITMPGVAFDVTEQVPFARVRGSVIPLAGSPFVDGGALYVPVQLVAELAPRFGTGLAYDRERSELRVITFGETRPAPAETPALKVERGSAGRRQAPATRTTRPAANTRAGTALRPPGARRRLVVIDAGHGGPDQGMSGPIGRPTTLYEKDITLAVAKLLATALRTRGVDVLMTRTSDTLIALADRGRIANEHHGDLFLSVHVNAANPTWKDPAAARGFETYFLAEAKTEDAKRVERMENEAVRFETGASVHKGDPLSFIINDMAQNEHLRESSDLAEQIQESLLAIHPGPSRGVKQANFAVLRTSYMPAVLVEIGFGTNPAEATYISDSARQRQLAAAIADATIEYLARYERRVGVGGQ